MLFTLSFAISSYGQNQPASPSADIIYTGRLLGYSRVPSLQPFKAKGCPDTSPDDSVAAIDFLEKRNSAAYQKAILVGTGDNFSPQLEARVFNDPPPIPKQKYDVGNKELYFSDGSKWFFYKDVPKSVENMINQGLGTIPSDNVACFLRAAGFSAIVPGKHDFYFGAERVRQLARFLARTQKDDSYQPVQMLGANLVIQTSPITPKSIPPTLKEKPWFDGDWSSDYPVMNISDGATVYPWLSYVKLQIGKLPRNEKALEAFLKELARWNRPISKANLLQIIANARATLTKPVDQEPLNKLLVTTNGFDISKPIHLCPSAGNPNAIPRNVVSDCEPLDLNAGEVRLANGTIAYYLKLRPLVTGAKLAVGEKIGNGKPIRGTQAQHFSTLITGKNYGLCDAAITNCLRFSVHTPFFYFPHRLPQQSAGYTDPDPYVYVNDDAAIFGVVEPDLPEQVGILNFGWANLNDGLTSKVSVEDPADALLQQLEYFEVQHPGFKGLKILLAQTSPQRAKKLSARFPEFQIVVSEADLEQATSEITMQTTWNAESKSGSLVAVPAPYFDSKTRKGSVHFGTIKAESSLNGNQVVSWKLSTSSLDPQPITEDEDQATTFWDEVKQLRNCLPATPAQNQPNLEYLRLLVLCSMRERFSADVALIQSRDLYEKLPLLTPQPGVNQIPSKQRMLQRPTVIPSGLPPNTPPPPVNAGNFQQMLDRLIWKGDLLTLLYVPGDALKTALDLSSTFENDENATLSLVVDRGRKLETLGISKDKITNEYLINGLPLDGKKIYAVATTDFIGAGDTGYPALASAALNPKTHPAAFPEKLVSISSLVCRKLFGVSEYADNYCLEPIVSEKYLDETSAPQIEPQRQPSALARFFAGLPFKGPNKIPDATTNSGAVEQKVQRRSIWMLSLKDLSLAFNSLNNNFTDKEIDEKFSGNPTSSVQAKHSRDFRFGLDLRFSRSSHKRDFYIEPGIDYKRQTTGDTPETVQVSQISNRAFGDAGFVLWRAYGRPVPNIGLNLSLHSETQLQRPFSNFTLGNANSDMLTIYQARSFVVLPRLGFRWQNREHFAEFGIQGGKEFKAFRGYAFDTAGGEVQCTVNPLQTIAKCISENSKTADGITKDGPVRVLLEDRPRAGVYWKTSFSVPFGPRVKYILTDEADFLFVSFHKDTSLDTRFRDISKHSLSFSIFPSISIGPTLRLLLYQNKVNRDFLIQKEFGIETRISFDIFNRRETGVQFMNKP